MRLARRYGIHTHLPVRPHPATAIWHGAVGVFGIVVAYGGLLDSRFHQGDGVARAIDDPISITLVVRLPRLDGGAQGRFVAGSKYVPLDIHVLSLPL
jgi:hypothetical protein